MKFTAKEKFVVRAAFLVLSFSVAPIVVGQNAQIDQRCKPYPDFALQPPPLILGCGTTSVIVFGSFGRKPTLLPMAETECWLLLRSTRSFHRLRGRNPFASLMAGLAASRSS